MQWPLHCSLVVQVRRWHKPLGQTWLPPQISDSQGFGAQR
jgi:hypothetical protein